MMRTENLMPLLLASFLLSCNDSLPPPYLVFRADFDPAGIPCVEQTMRSIAERRNFRIYEKDREEMKILSSDKDAFFMSYYHPESKFGDITGLVLVITNVGSGTKIMMSIEISEILSKEESDEIANEALNSLSRQCAVNLDPYEAPNG